MINGKENATLLPPLKGSVGNTNDISKQKSSSSSTVKFNRVEQSNRFSPMHGIDNDRLSRRTITSRSNSGHIGRLSPGT
jgi:hypothetical protein